MKLPIDADPVLLIWVTSLSGFGGIAYQLWKGGELSARRIFGAIILSALTGLLVFLWLMPDFAEVNGKLVSISILSGIGGTTIIDVLVASAERYGPEFIKDALARRRS